MAMSVKASWTMYVAGIERREIYSGFSLKVKRKETTRKN
jgi:hypothetical protein